MTSRAHDKQGEVWALSRKADLISTFCIFCRIPFSPSSYISYFCFVWVFFFPCALSHLLLELAQLHWEMHFYWHNHSRQSLMYQQGYHCNRRIYYCCCETTAMLSHLTLQLPSCLLPATQSIANCPFQKAASMQPGDVLFYSLLFLLLP